MPLKKVISQNGFILMIISTFLFSFASLFVKISSNDCGIPVFEIVFVRSLINTIIIVIIAGVRKENLLGVNKKLLLTRSLLGFTALVAFFYSLSLIKFANAVILTYTSPIFAAIFSVVFLKHRASPILGLKIFVALAGATLVIKPSFEMFNLGGLLGLASGMLAASAYMSVKELNKSNGWVTIVFYFSFISSVLSLPMMLNDYVMPDKKAAVLLISVGVFASFGQIFMTKAYQFLEASQGTLISLFSIVISMVLSHFVLGENLGLLTIIGGTLVFAGTGGVTLLRPLLFHRHPNKNF